MDRIEELICQRIDEHRDELLAFAEDIWTHAELGFFEHRTAAKFSEALRALGIETEEGLAVTGVKGRLAGGACSEQTVSPARSAAAASEQLCRGAAASGGGEAHRPTVCLMGEFDGLPIPTNPHANPETGAAHCCGHHAQLTGVLGAAIALTDPEIRAALDGDVVFFGVPAEEYVDIGRRNEMRKNGLIRYGCGKCELIRIGALDDVDLVVGHHASCSKKYLIANRSCNGFVTKLVRFFGRAAHAAGEPQRGIDAMSAAQIAMHAVDVQRETFRDRDTVRVHSCITKTESAANVIADEVLMEYSIRGKTIAAYEDAAKKVDRALRAGAVATGCGVTIETLPGNLPIVPVKDASVTGEALALVAGNTPVTCTGPDFHSTSSGDYGDISCIMPLLQFNTGGFSGSFHTPDVEVSDEEDAYMIPAKVFALMAYRLLRDGAARARDILAEFEPTLTKEQYLNLMESMMSVETIEPNPLPLLDAESVI